MAEGLMRHRQIFLLSAGRRLDGALANVPFEHWQKTRLSAGSILVLSLAEVSFKAEGSFENWRNFFFICKIGLRFAAEKPENPETNFWLLEMTNRFSRF